MKNVLIINTHHHYPFSEGALNKALVEKAEEFLKNKGYNIKTTISQDEYDT